MAKNDHEESVHDHINEYEQKELWDPNVGEGTPETAPLRDPAHEMLGYDVDGEEDVVSSAEAPDDPGEDFLESERVVHYANKEEI